MSRRTKAQWQDLIAQQSSSGLSAAEFCRNLNLNTKYFSLRKKRLKNSTATTGFTRVVPTETAVQCTTTHPIYAQF